MTRTRLLSQQELGTTEAKTEQAQREQAQREREKLGLLRVWIRVRVRCFVGIRLWGRYRVLLGFGSGLGLGLGLGFGLHSKQNHFTPVNFTV